MRFIYVNVQPAEVKSAVRTLELLELLARTRETLTLRAVVAELGYPKSSAFNLLATLVSRGYVIREEPESYRLHEAFRNGPGWHSGNDAQLIAVAQPLMDALRDAEGETVFLGTRHPDGRVKILAKSVSRQAVRFDSDLCGTDPAYCTAMGRVLLAFWSPQRVDDYLAHERLIRLTDRTVVDRLQIRRIIEAARNDGHAISDQEAVSGGCGIAAPVRSGSGEVVAALDIATLSTRFEASSARLVEAVKRGALDLSLRLGFKAASTDGH